MTFGKRLRFLRKKMNMTQKDLADKFSLGESTIGMYERDEREPSFEFVRQLADFFNVTTDYLLGRTDHPNPSEQDDIPEELKDPELGLFFKELAEAPEERREQLLKIWEILKSEGERKPGDRQK
ncbi:helix-turn-helix domain-containing protein [Geobacillus stearothermophilus]|uniref:helix-turn-helix domain-containing protein n=1 Tax=Geobacillus TaxID=129337 RepID=UPI000EF56C32|nr:helix-turn-helix transcriptional regulator [Geobacillus stearothermophilus]RLP99452.1 XRE family transcriptional regulator [Geobacillus stearothermophilus]